LVRNEKIFNFLYKFKNNINFLTLEKNSKIISSIGLIFNNYKISNIKKIFYKYNQVIWLTVWCTDKKISGTDNLRLINYLVKKIKNKITIATVGCNLYTFKIYKILGFKCGKLNHFYYVNKKKKFFNLIKTVHKNNSVSKENSLKLIKLDLKENYTLIFELKKYEILYKKNFEYFKKKYLDNKFMRYKYLFLKDKNRLKGFFILREDKFKNSKCLRLIEFFGDFDKIPKLTTDFQNLCDTGNYEYIDFYNFGIDKQKIIQSGLKLKNQSNQLVIPNYYMPFIKKNINLRFAFYPPSEKMILFKGDCDQDRPN